MKNMKVVIAVLAIVSIAACAKKHKTDTDVTSVQPAPGIVDTSIVSKDMDANLDGTSDSGKLDGLYTVNFEYDKSTLTAEARQKAQQDATWMKAHPSQAVQIEGHCDRHGSIEYNLALGERRANSVKKYLTNLGVNGSNLSTISYGKEKLLDQSENESADAKNRRANFKLASAPIENKRM